MITQAIGWFASYEDNDKRWYEPVIIWKVFGERVIGMVRRGQFSALERVDIGSGFTGYVTEEEMKDEESCDEME